VTKIDISIFIVLQPFLNHIGGEGVFGSKGGVVIIGLVPDELFPGKDGVLLPGVDDDEIIRRRVDHRQGADPGRIVRIPNLDRGINILGPHNGLIEHVLQAQAKVDDPGRVLIEFGPRHIIGHMVVVPVRILLGVAFEIGCEINLQHVIQPGTGSLGEFFAAAR